MCYQQFLTFRQFVQVSVISLEVKIDAIKATFENLIIYNSYNNENKLLFFTTSL